MTSLHSTGPNYEKNLISSYSSQTGYLAVLFGLFSSSSSSCPPCPHSVLVTGSLVVLLILVILWLVSRSSSSSSTETKRNPYKHYTLPFPRVGHFSAWYIPFFSVLKKEYSVLFRSFLEFLATYEIHSVLF